MSWSKYQSSVPDREDFIAAQNRRDLADAKLRALYREEMDKLRAKGATSEDFMEPACRELERPEYQADDIQELLRWEFIRDATPDMWREEALSALRVREQHPNSDLAYEMEKRADEMERTAYEVAMEEN